MSEPRYQIDADSLGIFHDFLGEAPQLLSGMEAALLELAANPSAKEPIGAVMRSLHTLKGIFGFLGLEAMHGLCHRAEDGLQAYRDGAAAPPKTLLQWQLQALDAIRAQMQSIGAGVESGSFEVHAIPGLEVLPEITAAPLPQGEAASRSEAGEVALPAQPSAERALESAQQDSFIRIRVEKMDALLELVGEMAICQSQVGEGLK